jgi:hypothetical protein
MPEAATRRPDDKSSRTNGRCAIAIPEPSIAGATDAQVSAASACARGSCLAQMTGRMGVTASPYVVVAIVSDGWAGRLVFGDAVVA